MTLAQPLRRRGRPPADPARQDNARQQILEAAGRVYAETGFHGLTLERVAVEAGLSRPTLYKHFPDAPAITEALLQAINDRLIQSMLTAVTASDDPFQRMGQALLAWRGWGEETDIARLLPTLYSELHNPHSPACRHRQRTLAVLGDLIHHQILAAGRPAASPLAIRSLLNGIEFLGYQFLLDADHSPEHWQATLRLMLRLALGLLGDAEDWRQAERWAARFGLTLTDTPSGDTP